MANAIKTRREEVTPLLGEQISSSKKQEDGDESYIPLHSQKEIVKESTQQGSHKYKSIHMEDGGESMPGKKYAWYRTPPNLGTSIPQGTHIQKGWTETV